MVDLVGERVDRVVYQDCETGKEDAAEPVHRGMKRTAGHARGAKDDL